MYKCSKLYDITLLSIISRSTSTEFSGLKSEMFRFLKR